MYISLNEVPKHIAKIRGKKVAIATVYRWARIGVRGIKLETIVISRTRYTREDWLMRFFRETAGSAPTPREDVDALLAKHRL